MVEIPRPDTGSLMDTYVPPTSGIVGLDAPWVDDRWFYTFDGLIGHPAQAVTLGFSTAQQARRTILIRTESPATVGPPSSLALSAFHLLISAAGFADAGPAIESFSYDEHDWHKTLWTLNGSDVHAVVRHHTSGWCAFAQDDENRGIAIASNSEDLTQMLALEDLHRADAFNVDFLDPQEMSLIRTLQPPSYIEPFRPLAG